MKNHIFAKCQKIYHEQCLKDWEIKRKSVNLNLFCPNCRNELPFEQWEKNYTMKKIEN